MDYRVESAPNEFCSSLNIAPVHVLVGMAMFKASTNVDGIND